MTASDRPQVTTPPWGLLAWLTGEGLLAEPRQSDYALQPGAGATSFGPQIPTAGTSPAGEIPDGVTPDGGREDLRQQIRIAALHALIRAHPDSGALAHHFADAVMAEVVDPLLVELDTLRARGGSHA